ncbi:MAG: tRNA (adenosine(37)-N6)-threonylcarbamoyltransferase complex ATPase subunit type 1 TsaE [Alphaproteobacteria bacterium]|nr:tRNA (adenosine(37)-N6)-threonylcarbamoyltransferase complex ATPase subunit type 1 TsaE [Alphaproteobacteria bacterium]
MSIIKPEQRQQRWQADSEDAMIALAPLIHDAWCDHRCITLQGPLGAGKSVFARALIRHLANDTALDVPSPTFTLLQTYDTPDGTVWHYDLYRLGSPTDIYELGWEEALQARLILIEWPERLGALLPQRRLDITMTPDQALPDLRHLHLQEHSHV